MNTENISTEVITAMKEEKLSDDDAEIDLYADHEIKEEMVIGPVVLQRVVNATNCYADVPVLKEPISDIQDNKFDQFYFPKQIKKETDSKEITSNEHNENVDTQPKEKIKNRKRNKKQSTFNKPTKRRIKTDKTNNQTTNNVFKCNDCNKQYDRQSDLVEHIQSHEKIKQDIYFKCKPCSVVLQRVVNATNCYEGDMSRFNLRRKLRISYFEPEEPNFDEYIFCDKCVDYVYEYCAIHGPLLVVPDDKIYDRNNKPCHVVDAEDANKSNWMRYVNCARHCSEQNLVAYQYQGQLYYRTTKIIPRFTELMVFYGSEFAHFLKIDLRRYNSPAALLEIIDAPLPKKPRLDTDNKIDEHDAPKETRKVADPKEITKNEHLENTLPKVQAKTKPIKKSKTLNRPSKKPIETDKNNNKMTDNVFKCSGCNKQYNRKSDLVEHIQSHDKMKQDIYFKCKQCSYTDITQDTLQRHVKNVHSNKDKKHECGICDYRSNQISHIKTHLLIHSGAKPYSCSKCEYKCSEKGSLKRHLRIHTGEKPYSCSMCEYKCSEKGSLKKHLRIHTGEKPYSCSMCEYKCSQKISLKTHLRIHTGEKPYSCSMCEYKCSVKGSLKEHLRIHTGEKPYSCSMCEYKCTLKGYLKKHLRIHTGEKPYSCSMCEYKCSVKGSLKKHLRIHTGEKPYSCSMCEYKCNQKGDLKTHLRIHTGEKPYSCSMCEYKCNTKSSLKTHLRIHTGEKPYSCSMCEYKCNQKGDLKTHLRIHTGEKPYSCSMCEYKCNTKSSLKTHLRIHTGEKPYSCSMCEYKCNQKGSLKRHLKIHSK